MREGIVETRDLIAKGAWGAGPWVGEPDRVEWRFAGFPCLMRRTPMGIWCGYVAVGEGHPWFEQRPDDIEARAHGGLNYADTCNASVCHVPRAGESDHVYWVGFDCGHGWDVLPGLEAQMREALGREPYRLPGAVYRDQAYVMAQVDGLARQALEAIAGLVGD
jgi:hypothetical protein